MSEPTTCALCGVDLFSPAACYGPVGGPVLCVLCWLETADLMRQEQALDRATDILVDKELERERYEDLAEQHLGVLDKLARRLPERHPRRGVGPMLPLEGM